MNKLILLLKELENLSSLCNRCGMCQAVCPVFIETGHESDVSRGKIALLNGLITEIIENPEKVLDRLNKCVLCGSCEASCPRKVKTIEIFIKARIIITGYTGLSFFKKILLQKIVAQPLFFDKTAKFFTKYQKLFFKPSNNKLETLSSRRFVPLSKNRNIPPIARNSFHSINMTKKIRHDKDKTLKIAFFTGCLIDKIMPEIGLSCLKALEYHNVQVYLFKEEGCCGLPAITAGDIDTFNTLAEYNARLFSSEKFDFVLTACASCTFTIKKLWPLIYSGQSKEMIKEISSKTMDITAFISRNFADSQLEANNRNLKKKQISVTLHDPCHLKKSFGIAKEPRKLIEVSPDYKLKEMNNPDSCCGFGGSFNLAHYELSSDIGAKKCKNIEETNASIVATGCPACIIQLKDQLAKTGSTIKVRHVMELYSNSLK